MVILRNRHHPSSATATTTTTTTATTLEQVDEGSNYHTTPIATFVPNMTTLHQRGSPVHQMHSRPNTPFQHDPQNNQYTNNYEYSKVNETIDDADVAAGAQERGDWNNYSNNNNKLLYGPTSSLSVTSLSSAPTSCNSVDTTRFASDVEFFEDLVSEPVLVLGIDISHLSRQLQFIVCAAGVFFFSLLYGYLQELISVQLCNRKLGLFLAMVQFSGYTILAYLMRNMVYEKQKKQQAASPSKSSSNLASQVPLYLYLSLSLLRAVDLAMTNLAMQYINYPAKTLMKSSRVVFTMIFGVVITRKHYKIVDYLIVLTMVAGLALFMHADANSSAVFHHMGVIMLTISLVCDGAITNMSESIMNKFGVGQDEFIFRMYSIALIAISAAAAYKGDLREGILWMSQPGTYDELNLPINERTWSVPGKIVCISVFSAMGFFGSSCSAAITKNFGALSMSITSTARKATTLFLSFFLFNNVCTWEHVGGIIIFITALTAKSLRRRGGHHKSGLKTRRRKRAKMQLLPMTTADSAPPLMGIPVPLAVLPVPPTPCQLERGDDYKMASIDESSLSSVEEAKPAPKASGILKRKNGNMQVHLV